MSSKIKNIFIGILLLLALTFTNSSYLEDVNYLRFLEEKNSTNSNESEANSTKGLPAIKCFWLETNSMAVFDLKKLQKSNSQSWDHNFTTTAKETVVFNICDNLVTSCKKQPAQVGLLQPDENCTVLAGPQKNGNEWKLVNSTDPYGGFYINMPNGAQCKGTNKNYTTQYKMLCNPNMTNSTEPYKILNSKDFDTNKCENELIIESKEACPKANFFGIWKFLNDYSYLFGAILIAAGLFGMFFGAKLIVVTIFLITTATTITAVFLFMFYFALPNGGHPAIIWVVLGISIVCGLVLGYFITRYNKIILGIILGCYMGYILGILLFDIALVHIQADPNV